LHISRQHYYNHLFPKSELLIITTFNFSFSDTKTSALKLSKLVKLLLKQTIAQDNELWDTITVITQTTATVCTEMLKSCC